MPDSHLDGCLVDPETSIASAYTKAAICVRIVDDQCVLRFTLFLALCCVLHRPLSQVIRCQVLYLSSKVSIQNSLEFFQSCQGIPTCMLDGWWRILRGLTTPALNRGEQEQCNSRFVQAAD